MELMDYLKYLVEHEASDLYLTTDTPPSARVEGHIKLIEPAPLPAGRVKELAYSIMSPEQKTEFETNLEMNIALSPEGLGRFRVNIFKQRNEVGMVIRNIKVNIPSVEQLGLPPMIKDLIMEKRGLILFVGATGSGKSSSLAALIDHRNTQAEGHIITIEDPIEFIHSSKKSIVNQRELGIDTLSYGHALKNTLRQAPDVILIGEIRSEETMDYAIAFSETGHLCLSTLHANNANQAIDRIINFFPAAHHKQILMDLSLNLRAIISQRLLPGTAGKRVAAVEIMLNTPLVADLIKRGEIEAIKDLMSKSENLGMQTFDSALYKLYQEGKITLEEALRNADSQTNLRLKVSLAAGATQQTNSQLSIEDDSHNSSFPS